MQLKREYLQAKEHAKKRNVELLSEQKLLISNGKQLDQQAENLFGDRIKQAAVKLETVEKETEDVRQEVLELEQELRYLCALVSMCHRPTLP